MYREYVLFDVDRLIVFSNDIEYLRYTQVSR